MNASTKDNGTAACYRSLAAIGAIVNTLDNEAIDSRSKRRDYLLSAIDGVSVDLRTTLELLTKDEWSGLPVEVKDMCIDALDGVP